MKPATVHTLFKPHIRKAAARTDEHSREESAPKKARIIHKLSCNENLFGPSPAAIKAARSQLAGLNQYRFQSDARFRKALSQSFGQTIPEDQFLPGNGTIELLDLICQAFLEPGDECIISSPSMPAYRDSSCLVGAKIIDIPLEPRYFELDIPGILGATGPKTKLVFIGSPNNPTGSLVTRTEMDSLLKNLPRHAVVIYDEGYHQYVTDTTYARASDYINKGFPVIGLHSFSKAYGLAGLRLGYAFSTPDIARYLRRLRRPYMINSVSMQAGIAALTDHSFIEKTVLSITREKDWMYKGLQNLGLRYWTSNANFILIRTAHDATAFASALRDRGILVAMGEAFGAPGCIRVTIGPRKSNKAFMQAVATILQKRSV
jgi:histidinol-phosphate aminotransferase